VLKTFTDQRQIDRPLVRVYFTRFTGRRYFASYGSE